MATMECEAEPVHNAGCRNRASMEDSWVPEAGPCGIEHERCFVEKQNIEATQSQ